MAPCYSSVTAKRNGADYNEESMSRLVFVVEDDHDIASLVKFNLENAGFQARVFTGGAGVLAAAEKAPPAGFLLGIMPPDGAGRELCGAIRRSTALNGASIIFLTAKAEETDRVVGLELGADDYVTKPFSPKALVARVKALLRRVDRSRQEAQVSYQYGKLSMDLNRHEVTVQGKDVPLTAKEFGLLEHLLRHPGRVLTREVLLNQVWGYDYFGTTRTVDVHVRRLKQKIPLLDEAILSVKSLGYKLKEP